MVAVNTKFLDEVVDSHCRSRPESEACRDAFNGTHAMVYSYFELVERSRRISLALLSKSSLNGLPCEHATPLGICMNRGFHWYAMYIAAIRIGMPVVPLTQDIVDINARDSRNEDILSQLKPLLVVVDDRTPGSLLKSCDSHGIPYVAISELLGGPCVPTEPIPRRPGAASLPLAYLYTGGTTRASKCVLVSHAMAAHEMAGYPVIAPNITHTDRVIQHSSTYWGATFLGQLNIALAFGASVVFCDNQPDLSPIIERESISVLGVVPSQLGAVSAPCPSVTTVFTWGEKMSASVACKWKNRVTLIELLVSTEYWLCLYAVGGESGFRILPSADVTSRPVALGEEGTHVGEELLIGGDCVTPFGYTDDQYNQHVFVTHAGKRYFRSSDLVRFRSKSQLEFLGRSDSMVKIGGEWKDLFVIEQAVKDVDGVNDAAIAATNSVIGVTAFIVLSDGFTENTLSGIRKLVNESYINVQIVGGLPRHPVTGKVDRSRLSGLLSTHSRCPPTNPRIPSTILVWTCWLMAIILIVWGFSGVVGLLTLPLTSLFLVYFEPVPFVKKRTKIYAFERIAIFYRNAISTIPAGIVTWSVLWVVIAPRIVSVGVGGAGVALYVSRRGDYWSVLAWMVTFWTGLPRQLEKEDWIGWIRDKLGRSHTSTYQATGPSTTDSDDTPVEREWEPFVRKRTFSESKSLEASLGTFDHTDLRISEADASGFSKLVPPPRMDIAASDPLPDSMVAAAVSSIVGSVCAYLPRPLSASTVLSSVNSLSAVEIANAIRDSAGKALAVSDVLGASTLGDLISRAESAPDMPALDGMKQNEGHASPQTHSEMYRCQLWGWGFPCTWVLELTNPPDLNAPWIDCKSLDKAVAQLASRHPAFQVGCVDPMALSYWMNETLVVVGLLRHVIPGFLARPVRAIGSAVYQCWSRVKSNEHRRIVIGWKGTSFYSESEMRTYLMEKRRKRDFYAPLEIDVMTLYSGTTPRYFVRLYLTHAFSDGSCIVPLAKELNELYSAAVTGRPPKLPPPPPSALALQEARLRHSLTDPIGSGRPDALYMCYNMDMDEGGPSFGRIVILRESLVVIAERAAARLACPIDLLLLSAVACSLARLWGWTDCLELALMVPLRDGPHEADVVGFLADQRNFDIPLLTNPSLCTLMTVVQTVHALRRKRGWTIPTPFSNCQRTLVNIVQANFPTGVPFRQELLLQQQEADYGFLYRPMELYIEQVDVHMWSFKARCRAREYSLEKWENFVQIFKQVIVEMLTNPNTPLGGVSVGPS